MMDFDIEEALKKLREFLDVFGLEMVDEISIHYKYAWSSEHYVRIVVHENKISSYPEGGTIYFNDYGQKRISGFQSSASSTRNEE